MIPWAVGRMVSEIPSRMLRVARVAMIDGILTPRIRPGVDQSRLRRRRGGSRPTPIRIWRDGGLGADQEGGEDHAED